MKICVIGLGIIGMPVLEYLKINQTRLNVKICGYDIISKKLKGVKTYKEWNKIPKCNVYIVSSPSAVIEDVCKKIKNKNSLLLIESTSPVGTCRTISKKYGFKHIVHCPHRYFPNEAIEHGVRQLRVIGAIDDESLKMGINFYNLLNIPLHICSSIELAEMTKIAENANRFVEIAFAEELKIIAEENNISFEELREACNTKWNINLKEAREGIGLICLPQDIRFLIKASKSDTFLLSSAIITDEKYKKIRKV